MKLPALLLIVFFPFYAHATLADTIPAKKNLSKIILTNGSFVKGYILQADDSTITFVSKKNWSRLRYDQTERIAAENISGITKNFKNGMTMGEGILLGGVAGILIGFTLGLSQDCEDPDGDCDFFDKLLSTKSFRASLILGSGLGLGGMILGAFSKKKDRIHYDINGNRTNIRNNKLGLIF